MIQQALTLYVEKMPEYYATCKFYNIDEYSLKKTLQVSSTKSNEYTTIFYTKLFISSVNSISLISVFSSKISLFFSFKTSYLLSSL